MFDMAMAAILGLAMQAPECVNPPSRASDSYWTYIEACGCSRLDAPSGASSDHDRFLAACSAWRQRNPEITVTVPGGPVPSPSPSPTPPPRECGIPPSRASDAFWSYLAACGCGQVQAPSAASPDHERFLKACGMWRESNPRVLIVASPTPRPSARPSPSPSPRRGGM